MKRAFSMSKYLVEAGHQATIILQHHEENLKAAEIYPGIEYLYYEQGTTLSENREKRAMIKSRHDDVIVVCGNSARNFVWRFGKSRPLMVLDHPEVMSAFEEFSYLKRCFEYLREWIELFLFDGHLAVSRYIERRLQKRLNLLHLNAEVLYSPFAAEEDLKSWNPVAAKSIREQYGKKMVLYLGSFFAAYGFYEILHAAARLRQVRNDFVIVMAGAGPELEGGQAFIAENDLQETVSFPGFLSGETMKNYLHAAHAFICPLADTVRDWARSPGKIYMYAATRHPIVTCKIGEAADTLGEAGFYYEQGDVDSLANQISLTLDRDDSPVEGIDYERLFSKSRTKEFLAWLHESFGL
ncbi:glycosyltransferase family 4 protein [Bythopirellula polymerisocia]|nr:glycosyltransferase family 4 protein [Bythopirellula polymerisocia]